MRRKRMTTAKILILFLSLVLVTFTFGVSTQNTQKTIKWKMQVLWDPGTLPYEIEQDFADRVYELSGGRLDITVYPPGGLVPTMQMFDAVKAGMFQMMKTYDGYYLGKLPVLAFTSSVAGGFSHPWQYEVWFWELGGIEIARKAYAQHNMYYVAPTIYGQEPINSTFPIQSVEDFNGKKGRFVGMALKLMEKLGCSVTPLATAEVYSALDKGVIDLADRGGLAANWDAGLQEVIDYIILPGFHQPTTATSYVANMNAWNKLPDDLKAILVMAGREASAELFAKHYVEGQDALEKFKESGVEVIHLPESEVKKARKAAISIWKEYAAKSSLAKKAYESQTDFMKRLGLID